MISGETTPPAKGSQPTKLSLPFEKYELNNGLQVVLHIDRSDPVVACSVQYHVGSAREKSKRTGFAHLFEHLLFKGTENMKNGDLDKLIINAGGSTPNGYTSEDETVYMEVVPKNALERVLWIDSERMGYFISTLDNQVFALEKEIVKNEKRQIVNNRAYGYTGEMIRHYLYPENHPYRWPIGGYFEDLQNAEISDVREFYNRYYGPNNATLVIAGDFDVAQAKSWVAKYFGEIKPIGKLVPLKVPPVTLSAIKKRYHEDKFAKLAELTMVWPSARNLNDDSHALNYLAQILAGTKHSVLYQDLVESNLSFDPDASQNSLELGGTFKIRIRARKGKSLTDIETAVNKALNRFAGPNTHDLQRVKANLEAAFFSKFNSVLNKARNLASNNGFTGDPLYALKQLDAIGSVSREDVMRVFTAYIKGKPYVATSFVPEGKLDLVAKGSRKGHIVAETSAVADNVPSAKRQPFTPSASTFDRSVIPPLQKTPVPKPAPIWRSESDNGMKLMGIEHYELPLVRYRFELQGGRLLESLDSAGIAQFTAKLMSEGTASRSPAELEEAIALLGADIKISAENEKMVVSVKTLARNFEESLALVEEIILHPRWDAAAFDRIKKTSIDRIHAESTNPNYLAGHVLYRNLYGENHPLSRSSLGNVDSLERIGLNQLKTFYAKQFTPTVCAFLSVGALGKARVLAALKPLISNWKPTKLSIPQFEINPRQNKATVYLVDRPGASQSVIFLGHLALAFAERDFFPAQVMSYRLAGPFTSILNQQLREQKGYTYRVVAGFTGSRTRGLFSVTCDVRTDVTAEALSVINDALNTYREGISQDELNASIGGLIKSKIRSFETLRSLATMLSDISNYDLATDFILAQTELARKMSVTRHRELARQYIRPEQMVYVIVGDASLLKEKLEKLELGPLVHITADDLSAQN